MQRMVGQGGPNGVPGIKGVNGGSGSSQGGSGGAYRRGGQYFGDGALCKLAEVMTPQIRLDFFRAWIQVTPTPPKLGTP
jgi:hypothetical protein